MKDLQSMLIQTAFTLVILAALNQIDGVRQTISGGNRFFG